MTASGNREMPRQLPFDLGHESGLTREDLVVSPANAEAMALIDNWPSWPSGAVILAGPPGCGKTHLATIWKQRARAMEVGRDDVEQAIGQQMRPILVDDADGEGLDQQGLFHLLNAARSAASSVLLTARRFPAAWGIQLPDLASRLRSATLIEIREPDDALLAGVMVKLFADRQIEVDLSVIQFLVRRIERSLDTAIRVVDRLDRRAWERKTGISRALAAETISSLDGGQAELDF